MNPGQYPKCTITLEVENPTAISLPEISRIQLATALVEQSSLSKEDKAGALRELLALLDLDAPNAAAQPQEVRQEASFTLPLQEFDSQSPVLGSAGPAQEHTMTSLPFRASPSSPAAANPFGSKPPVDLSPSANSRTGASQQLCGPFPSGTAPASLHDPAGPGLASQQDGFVPQLNYAPRVIDASSHPYQCHICGRGFTNLYLMKDHIRGIHNHEFDCVVCDPPRPYTRTQVLEVHLWNSHRDVWGFTCMPCRRCFSTQQRFDGHMNGVEHRLKQTLN